MNKKIKSLTLLLISSFIAILSIFVFPSNEVQAIGTWQGNMPEASYNDITGLFPQIIEQRTITLPEERFYFTTSSWNATFSTGTVYCADQKKILRFGKFDRNTYYFTTDMGAPNTYSQVIESYKERALDDAGKDYAGKNSLSLTAKVSDELQDKFNKDAYAMFEWNGKDYTNLFEDVGNMIMKRIMGMLSGEEKAPAYSEDTDSEETYEEWNGDPNFGPEIVVMETGDQTEDGYQVQSSGEWDSKGDKKEKQASYILTALEDVYGNGEYSKKYTLEDIQTAYWMLVDPDGQESLIQRKLTANGKELYKKSEEYAQFAEEVADGYDASIDAIDAQVIVDRNAKEYIVGPFTANYPDYKDISYIKSMFITTDAGATLIVDEEKQDFEIIMAGGTEVPGSNGITKSYPKNGDIFFIKLSATKANNPKSIKFGAKFEYINGCSINYEQLGSEAHVYQYIGYNQKSGDYSMLTGDVEIIVDVYYKEWEEVDDHTDSCASNSGKACDCSGEWDWVEHKFSKTYYTADTYQPYVEMSKDYKEDVAQDLTAALDGERDYKIVEKDATIDLTMELGGYVWEDTESGKENVLNGTADNKESRIPNIIVTLKDSKGNVVTTTKTLDKDIGEEPYQKKGSYHFTGLNAMEKYSVTFTYNGQYYQPTTFAGADTWGTSQWPINSNAKDNINERKSFNLKFEKIGSSPENYTGAAGVNKTYTKQELLDAGIIDEFGNLIGNSNASMVQYVKDCMMNAYTELYPYPSLFVIDVFQYPSMLTPNAEPLYPNAYYINLGLDRREESDLAIKKDVDHVTLEINGQTHTYTYDTLENKENADEQWDISVRISDGYYNAAYTRELYKSDYLYKTSNYGENFADYGKSKADELEVYITYKIMVRNQAMSIQTKVDELVDYYDEDLEYVNNRSYIQIKSGDNEGRYDVKASNISRYSANTITELEGYDNLYITGLDDKYLTAGQTAYVYLTFKVKKDTVNNEDWLKLDEEIESGNPIGVGKENIVEVNGYSTRYAPETQVPNVGDVGLTPAGIVDKDSNPGNLNPTDVPKDGNIKHENFEDDTDKAPNIRIILYRDGQADRVISGNVFEDARTETIGLTTTGDGVRDDKDKILINGVTVQLVELMDNGTEFIWRTFENGSGTADKTSPIINTYNLVSDYQFAEEHDGAYAFKSFIPGKYVVRFIYGDTVKTVTPASLNMGGLNEKSYNGQDYKSTTYQEGITQNKTYTWREKSTWSLGEETLGKVLTEVTTFKADASNNETAKATVSAQNQKGYLYDITASDAKTNVSDAKDIESRRNKVNDYSDTNVTNYIAEVLASHKSDYTTMNDRNQLLNELMNNTKMTAETGLMVIELEYDKVGTDGNNKSNQYKIQNVDLGLEERPKAQLIIDKKVANVKVTLSNGSILFDAKNTASNVLWRDHKAYNVGYKGNLMDEDKFGSIENIRNNNSNKFGLIQLSMDEELMHGATMEITYQVTVANVGEVDYKDNLFYYTGNKGANAKMVTTKADQVIDYVANNLQFNVSNNSNWKVIEKEQIKSQGLVNQKLQDQVEKFNTVIVTESLNKDLLPKLADENNSNVSVPLVLTQLITPENDTDDLTYENIVEIVKTSNTVGRRMEYSVVGNQDPEKDPQELDSDKAEVVKILPPFGNAGTYIIIAVVILVAMAIIIVGTIFIKKKVLRK